MATNPWISKEVRTEQNLYEDLVIESLQFYGQDVYYLPRELVNVDKVFLDDIPSHFSDAYKIETYIENVDGFGGEGDLFSKFGVELRDQATFVVARRRWKKLIGDKLDSYNFRPREGDVIYIPFSKSLFEIFKVETETPFYQLNNLPTFRLQCELFEYNDEDFDTDIEGIDDIEVEGAYQYKLTMDSIANATATVTPSINVEGQLTGFTTTNRGRGYTSAPTVTIAPPAGNNAKFGTSSLDIIRGRGVETTYNKTGASGVVEAWVYVSDLIDNSIIFITGGNGNDDQTYLWGIDSVGRLVYSRGNNNGGTLNTLTGNDILFTENNWHHILIATVDTNNILIYFDFDLKLDTNLAGVTFDTVTSNGFAIGSSAARELDGVQWRTLEGFIDEFRVQVGSKADLIVPRYATVGDDQTLTTVTTAYAPNSTYDATLQHFEPVTATANALIDGSGQLSGVELTNIGLYYNTPPAVTLSVPFTGGNYKRNEQVTQVNSEYTIKGEVVKWSDSDNGLYLAHVGATDGKLHTFSTSGQVVGAESNAVYSPSLVGELQEIQQTIIAETPQANFFDNFEGDFLDFSENNPFGDVS